MIGLLAFILFLAALAGGSLYGYAYLKARSEKISVAEALLKVINRQ